MLFYAMCTELSVFVIKQFVILRYSQLLNVYNILTIACKNSFHVQKQIVNPL